MNQTLEPAVGTSDQRLAIFMPSLRGGGAERAMLNLATGIAARGISVDLVLAEAVGSYIDQVPRRVNVVDLGSRRVLRSLPGLVRYLRRQRPTSLLAGMGHANVVAVWARGLAGVSTTVVVRAQNTVGHATSGNQTALQARLLSRLYRSAYLRADEIVAVSNGAADALSRHLGIPRERIRVIYNPTIQEDLAGKAAEAPKHPWFAPSEPPVILGVGRLTAVKDFATLLRAFAEVRSRRQARLVILGEGEQRHELEGLVASLNLQADVAMPGFAANPYPYMRRAAVFVLSSRSEGLPNALIEALALGTPVVATDCPSGPREVLDHGRLGAVVPVGTPTLLAAAIDEALSRPREVAEESWLDQFRVDRVSAQYMRLLGLR